jgi:lipopolysaccharide export system permease protein
VLVFGNLLQRAIFFELVRVFLLSLTGITGIFVMGGIIAEATQRGLNPAQILAAIPLIIPSALPFTIPATTLFAACVVYGRLAADNEILALKSAGVHLFQITRPALYFGVGMTGVTMGLYYHLIPYTHYLLRANFMNDAEEYLYALLKKDRCIKMSNIPYSIYAQRVQGRRLEDVIFKRRAPRGEGYDVVARAREAELHVDMANKVVRVVMRGGTVRDENGRNQGHFQNQPWEVPLPANVGSVAEPRPRGMSYGRLFEQRSHLLARIAEQADEIDRTDQASASPDLPKHLENLRMILRHRQLELSNVDSELHLRPALSLGCLCFVLVGCPVGIWFSRSDFLSAFITCFLPIVFVYYPLVLCGTSYAKQGRVHPVLALEAANAVVVLIAAALFRRLLRH